MAVAGYGRAGKMQVQKAVFSQLCHPDGEAGVFPSSQDATDALAAAICYCGAARLPEVIRQAGAQQRHTGGRQVRSLSDVFTEQTVAQMLAAEHKKRG